MTSGLREAYLATEFAFTAHGQPFVMRIGIQNLEVRKLLADHGVDGALFITACNPASQPLSGEQNALAMRALSADLESIGLSRIFEGAGRDPLGNWPHEQSFIVLGIDRTTAEALGRKYGQNAIVWVDAKGIPALIELVDLG